MKNLTILVGLPRAGKSTFCSSKAGEIFILSSDRLRLHLYGQRFYRKGEAIMWAIHDLFTHTLLEQGLDLIMDETNTMASRRKIYIELAKSYGYRIECVWFNTDKEECKRRAIESEQPDLIHVIDRMASKFDEPTFEEGFDAITIL
jgi:predicted kinase